MRADKPYPQGTLVQVCDFDGQAYPALIVSHPSYYKCEEEYLILYISPDEPLNELEYSLPTIESWFPNSAVLSVMETVKGDRIVREYTTLFDEEKQEVLQRLHSILAISPDYLEDYPEPLGRVVCVDFPFSDTEQSKRRPAVAVNTPLHYERTESLIVLYCTTNLEVKCPTDYRLKHYSQAGLRQEGAVRCRTYTPSEEEVLSEMGRLRKEDFAEIQIRLRRAFGL